MENIEDPTNLTGISKLLNKQHVNERIDLEALERDMIGGKGVKKVKVIDPAREFRSRMQEINRSSGMEVLSGNGGGLSSESEPPQKSRGRKSHSSAKSKPSVLSQSYADSMDDSESTLDAIGFGKGAGGKSSSGSDSGSSGSDDSDDDSSDVSDSGDSFEDSGSDEMMDIMRGKQPKSKPHVEPVNAGYQPVNNHARPLSMQPPPRAPSYPQQTQPQYAPPHPTYQQMAPPHGGPPGMPGAQGVPMDPLDQAMQTYAGNTMDYGLASREDEEEKKAELLEDIDELKYELEDDEVDLSRIPEVDQDSTLDEIYNVRKILRRKYDRRRFNSFGTEFILAFAQGVEYICDGERKIGNMTVPDLTNWHNTVRTKLRKLRYETSTIVSDTMEKFNIGPIGRVSLELVPSAFLHSKMRKDQKGKANYTTNQMSAAYDQLSQYDD